MTILTDAIMHIISDLELCLYSLGLTVNLNKIEVGELALGRVLLERANDLHDGGGLAGAGDAADVQAHTTSTYVRWLLTSQSLLTSSISFFLDSLPHIHSDRVTLPKRSKVRTIYSSVLFSLINMNKFGRLNRLLMLGLRLLKHLQYLMLFCTEGTREEAFDCYSGG